jgi:hypothetical protein
MDTRAVAEHLGTTPRVFRQFLRSPISTFVAVGSGARYDFTERDLPTIEKRFAEWNSEGKPKPEAERKPITPKPTAPTPVDQEVWEDEGPIVLEDIRDPRVRARVKRDAQAADDRLAMLLLAAGLHITQLGDRKAS